MSEIDNFFKLLEDNQQINQRVLDCLFSMDESKDFLENVDDDEEFKFAPKKP